MADYVSVGVMPARRAGRRSRARLCPLCGNILSYGLYHTGIRSCTRSDCELQQNVITGECALPTENIPRAVARKLIGSQSGGESA